MNKEEIICPGETIKQLLEVNNYTQEDLAKKLGMELSVTTKILNGEAPITQDTALRLERVFCIGSSFWVNLEFNYRKKLKQFYDEEPIPHTKINKKLLD